MIPPLKSGNTCFCIHVSDSQNSVHRLSNHTLFFPSMDDKYYQSTSKSTGLLTAEWCGKSKGNDPHVVIVLHVRTPSNVQPWVWHLEAVIQTPEFAFWFQNICFLVCVSVCVFIFCFYFEIQRVLPWANSLSKCSTLGWRQSQEAGVTCLPEHAGAIGWHWE